MDEDKLYRMEKRRTYSRESRIKKKFFAQQKK